MKEKTGLKLKIVVALLAVLAVGIMSLAVTFYTTQQSLTLKGSDKIQLGLNGVYEEYGANALIGGKDVSDQVDISGEVDTSTPGTYCVIYKAGNLTMKRTVVVGDKMSPELVLEPAEDTDLKLGDEFVEPGYKAVDENGNDITDKVVVEGAELTKAGVNTITYTVADDNGNKTRLSREVTVSPNTDYDAAGLPICMYHYVYDENDPPADLYDRFGNYISMQALEEELNWLNEEGYYYPTWEEVRAYVDGELLLPDKSIVLCFDDGAKSFLKYGIPVLEKCKVPATSFVITSKDGEAKIAENPSDYVYYESHTHNMHRGGGHIGHGGIFTAISYEDGMADLKTSIEICGSSDAFAYPYGDYNDHSRKMVEDSGFMIAVTTQYGKAYPGDDPMLLPRVRMSLGQSLDKFISMVAPR